MGDSKFNFTVDSTFDKIIWHGMSESGERALSCNITSLWRKVILQSLVDFSTPSDDPKRLREKFLAEKWLLGNNSDFERVCEMASINSQMLRNMVKTESIYDIYQRIKSVKT